MQLLVEVLIDAGADLDESSLLFDDGQAPLLVAVSAVPISFDVVEHKSVEDGNTALHNATSQGHANVVQQLLAKGAAVDKCNKVQY
ncbi:hypothetical protein ACHHYP_20158 [Achlya hypogyna]|uniref:Uncharacterized protein n=1 Tax=Achlya hypogyna TaxID=1202772 RepID=A0A1V9Z1Y8_ACHHY|nr:hypothetical protein ACHHYP_20158 [Achlya hypogyna]